MECPCGCGPDGRLDMHHTRPVCPGCGGSGKVERMPREPLKPCSYPGCRLLVRGGNRCEKHRKREQREYDRQRGSAAKRGYGRRWRRYRKAFLARHPVCVVCHDVAKHVDHIQPVSGPDDLLFWESSNHQALCASCHNAKTMREQGGGGRKFSEG